MADDDKESKTEEASGKKISEAIAQGNIPFSGRPRSSPQSWACCSSWRS